MRIILTVSLLILFVGCKKHDISKSGSTVTEILFITSYGQSNSNGGGEPVVISSSQKYNSLMPFSGPRTDSGDVLFPLIPLTEITSESPITGAAEMFIDRIRNQGGETDFQIISTASGQGGYPIYYLSKDIRPFISGRVSPYNRVLDQVRRIKQYCDSIGKTFSVPFMYFTQGESEYETSPKTTYDEYFKLYTNLVNDLNNDILAITKQKNRFQFIGYQITDGIYRGTNYEQAYTVSKVQYDLGNDPLGSYVIACPSYMFRYQLVDHFLSSDARMYGAYLAIAAKKTFIDGNKFMPMHPTEITRTGNAIQIKFYVPESPLLIDNSIPLADNFGFRVVRNSATNDTIPITSVKIINENTIEINVSTNPQGMTLYYAVDPQSKSVDDVATNSFWFPSRGNLHDSQNIMFDNRRLYNYCSRFFLPIP